LATSILARPAAGKTLGCNLENAQQKLLSLALGRSTISPSVNLFDPRSSVRSLEAAVMADHAHPSDRRDFLKSGALAAGSSLFGAQLAAADPPPASETKSIELGPSGIPLRPFGKTGHKLPILGMGGSAFVQLFNASYGVPVLSVEDRVAMVRRGYDQGIRYFDTARVYGESERIVGQGLKGVREHCYVATKCHIPDPKRTRESVERSLKELDMDYVDCVQVHSPAIEAVGFDGAMKIHAELVKLRDEKLLRFIGLTTHIAFETVHQMIETDGFDQVLLAYGYVRRGMNTILSNTNVEFRNLCMNAAAQRGMAIVAMKIMGANMFNHNSGKMVEGYDATRLAELPGAAIRWVLQDPRVAMLNVGVSMPSDVDQNVATMRGDTAFTAADGKLLADFSSRLYESKVVKAMPVS
jgi:predicted aldo/keto reductase-like oxidoreductase